MVWSAKNMETICSVEPNQFPHKPMIVDQEASHHRRANQTSPQHTLPYQTNHTTPYIPHNAMPYCPTTPCNITLYKDQGASPTLFLLTRRVSLLAVSFMCHLLICSPLQISFFACVICRVFLVDRLEKSIFLLFIVVGIFSILKNC